MQPLRYGSTALLALVGFLTTALMNWQAGASSVQILWRSLLALSLMAGFGYLVGVAGERIAHELIDRKSPQPPPRPAPETAKPEEPATP